MLDQRRRRWADGVQELYKGFVFAGNRLCSPKIPHIKQLQYSHYHFVNSCYLYCSLIAFMVAYYHDYVRSLYVNYDLILLDLHSDNQSIGTI